MKKEALEKRLTELRNTLKQIEANGNATLGAISECEYWLKQLELEEDDSHESES
jgi:hypothetical protein